MFALRRGERERERGAVVPGSPGSGAGLEGQFRPQRCGVTAPGPAGGRAGGRAEGSEGRQRAERAAQAGGSAGRGAVVHFTPGGKGARPGQADPDGSSPVRTPPLLPGLPQGRPGPVCPVCPVLPRHAATAPLGNTNRRSKPGPTLVALSRVPALSPVSLRLCLVGFLKRLSSTVV